MSNISFLGHANVVRTLIEAGAESSINVYQKTIPLHWAENAEIAEMLLKINNHDINMKNDYGETPFSKAFQANNFDVMKLLVDIGNYIIISNLQCKDHS